MCFYSQRSRHTPNPQPQSAEDEETSIAGQPFSALQANLPKTFTQPGDLKFSDAVIQALGMDIKFNLLKKGSYPMTIDENAVKITLTLSEGGKT